MEPHISLWVLLEFQRFNAFQRVLHRWDCEMRRKDRPGHQYLWPPSALASRSVFQRWHGPTYILQSRYRNLVNIPYSSWLSPVSMPFWADWARRSARSSGSGSPCWNLGRWSELLHRSVSKSIKKMMVNDHQPYRLDRLDCWVSWLVNKCSIFNFSWAGWRPVHWFLLKWTSWAGLCGWANRSRSKGRSPFASSGAARCCWFRSPARRRTLRLPL